MYNFDEIIDRRGTNSLFVGNAEGLIACATRFSSGALPQLRIRILPVPGVEVTDETVFLEAH